MTWVLLAACAPEPDPAAWFGPGVSKVGGGPLGPALDPPLTLWVDPLVPGEGITLEARGAPPGAEVVFVVGRIGAERCPPFLAGTCVNVRSPAELARVVADGAGAAAIEVPLDAQAKEGVWLVLQAAEPGGGWVSEVVLRRIDPEPLPTLDYGDPFEPNTLASAPLVPGYFAGLTVDSDTAPDGLADRYEVDVPPNRVVTWQVLFFQGFDPPTAVDPDGNLGTLDIVTPNTQYELVTSSLVGGRHELLIGGDEYNPKASVYTVRLVVADGEPASWSPDADGDGFGDASALPTVAVDPPAGTVGNALDCDDADATRFPDAPEVCGDGIAQACDADEPCAAPLGALTGAGDVGVELVGARPFGGGALTGGDLDGDGIAELIVGGETLGFSVFAGPIFADGLAADAIARAPGDEADLWGPDVVVLGDANGDGLGDLAATGVLVDAGSENTGGLAILWGPLVGDIDLYAADVRLWGAEQEALGGGLAALGDLNGDGLGDLAVSGGSAAYPDGRIYVLTTPYPAKGPIAGEEALLVDGALGEGLDDDLFAAGDTDGDGLVELLVLGDGGWALLDPASTGTMGLGDASARLLLAGAGREAAGAGDLDGDGLGDVALAGLPGATDVATVLLGPLVGDVTAADATVTSSDVAKTDGEQVDGPGDLDGDGFADLIVASRGSGGFEGVAWVVPGPLAGAVPVEETGLELGASAQSGPIAAGVGDVTGDGSLDWAVARDTSRQDPTGADLRTTVTLVSGW